MVRVRFICTTKQDFGESGMVSAIFQIENELDEAIKGNDAYLQGTNLALESTYAVLCVESNIPTMSMLPAIPAKTTNTFCFLIPTNAGLYRLHLAYCPDHRFPKGSHSSLRWRVASRLWRLLPGPRPGSESLDPNIEKAWYRAIGWKWTTSQKFQPTQFKNIFEGVPAPEFITNLQAINASLEPALSGSNKQ
jgi:hypothetical protein